MEFYEEAVMSYITGPPCRFVRPQYEIPFANDEGGTCPDFVVLDFRDKTVYVIEVSAAANIKGLLQRVLEREKNWISPLKKKLKDMYPLLSDWQYHVTLFIREDVEDSALAVVGEESDVSIIPITETILCGWLWDYDDNNIPHNPLRCPACG